jgi:hypothetical protein
LLAIVAPIASNTQLAPITVLFIFISLSLYWFGSLLVWLCRYPGKPINLVLPRRSAALPANKIDACSQ